MIWYVSGGARSGKSRYAQELALKLSREPVYVATARIWDEDFAKRVERHRDERGPEWTTFETEKEIRSLPLDGRVVVIDCVTLWLTNLFFAFDSQIEPALKAFQREIDALAAREGTFIVVSNELGMGLHAETELGRAFTDLQGWANQHVARLAEHACFMVSGLPLKVK